MTTPKPDDPKAGELPVFTMAVNGGSHYIGMTDWFLKAIASLTDAQLLSLGLRRAAGAGEKRKREVWSCRAPCPGIHKLDVEVCPDCFEHRDTGKYSPPTAPPSEQPKCVDCGLPDKQCKCCAPSEQPAQGAVCPECGGGGGTDLGGFYCPVCRGTGRTQSQAKDPPLPVEILASALHDRIHKTSGRLIAAKSIGTGRTQGGNLSSESRSSRPDQDTGGRLASPPETPVQIRHETRLDSPHPAGAPEPAGDSWSGSAAQQYFRDREKEARGMSVEAARGNYIAVAMAYEGQRQECESLRSRLASSETTLERTEARREDYERRLQAEKERTGYLEGRVAELEDRCVEWVKNYKEAQHEMGQLEELLTMAKESATANWRLYDETRTQLATERAECDQRFIGERDYWQRQIQAHIEVIERVKGLPAKWEARDERIKSASRPSQIHYCMRELEAALGTGETATTEEGTDNDNTAR